MPPDFRESDHMWRDPFEQGFAQVEEMVGMDVTDDYKLTEVRGVGPSTAEKLEAAGIKTARQLGRYTAEQLATIDGIGIRTAENIANQYQYQKTRFKKPPDDVEKARDTFSERSPEARNADRSYNAPIASSYEQWAANPDRYDYPGVDTIPRARRADRVRKKASRLKERGHDISVEHRSKMGDYVAGKYSGGVIGVNTAASWDTVSVVAHELGHGVDNVIGRGRGGHSTGLFEDEEVREQAAQLAARRRPMMDTLEDLERTYDEQDLESELYADVFAVATEEPRAARRIAPKAVKAVQDTHVREIGRY